jgi:hypothetical protein
MPSPEFKPLNHKKKKEKNPNTTTKHKEIFK